MSYTIMTSLNHKQIILNNMGLPSDVLNIVKDYAFINIETRAKKVKLVAVQEMKSYFDTRKEYLVDRETANRWYFYYGDRCKRHHFTVKTCVSCGNFRSSGHIRSLCVCRGPPPFVEVPRMPSSVECNLRHIGIFT